MSAAQLDDEDVDNATMVDYTGGRCCDGFCLASAVSCCGGIGVDDATAADEDSADDVVAIRTGRCGHVCFSWGMSMERSWCRANNLNSSIASEASRFSCRILWVGRGERE